MEDLKKIQSLIDENKEEIPENVYLNLCNLTKSAFKNAGNGKKFFYLTLITNNIEQMEDIFDLEFNSYKQIVQMPISQATAIMNEIKENAYVKPFQFSKGGEHDPSGINESDWVSLCSHTLIKGDWNKQHIKMVCSDCDTEHATTKLCIITNNIIVRIEPVKD
jgi:hypothetical protein